METGYYDPDFANYVKDFRESSPSQQQLSDYTKIALATSPLSIFLSTHSYCVG